MIHAVIPYLPPVIMFAVTAGVCALFALPMRRWRPRSGVVRFYWRGVWVSLMAMTAMAGGMNVLVLLGLDVVGPTELLLSVLLTGFVALVVVGWVHMAGLGAWKVARRARRAG